MSAPSLGERLLIAQLTAHASVAAALSRVMKAPLANLRLVRPRADRFLFVPSDLRPADPSLVDELESGQMGLGGAVLDLAGSSPFAVMAPSPAWVRELNGFAWLGSLRTSGDKESIDLARRLVADWCRRNRMRPGGRGHAAEPEVIARRVTSWVVNAGFLLDEAEPGFYRAFTRTLGSELRALDAASRRASPGYPHLACLMALTLACIAAAGHDRDLPAAEARLMAELRQQILADGGHISRNPETVLDVLIDLLPIRQCYLARGLDAPPALIGTIELMVGHLRLMMLGSGTLARFNGVASARDDVLATVLAINAHSGRPTPTSAPGPSGYARLVLGLTTILVDCGRPAPLQFSGGAHAGALSFEMSHSGDMIIVNRGAPAPTHREAKADSRATASHSTLALDEQSSSRLVRSRPLERLIGGPAIAGPDNVTTSVVETEDEVHLTAVHDGYYTRFGILHERRLTLARNGQLLAGTDILRPHAGTLRLSHDLPLAVRFHLPVEATVQAAADGSLVIQPERGPPWILTAKGGRLAIEAGTDYAQNQGPSAARQAVVRAATPGETTVDWQLERA